MSDWPDEIDREPKPEMWPIREHGVIFEISEADHKRLHGLMNETYAAVRADMDRVMYGNENNYSPAPKPSRFKIWRDRIHDAWQVLLGRAEIGDGW